MSALAAAIASRAPSLGRGRLRWLNVSLLALAAALGLAAYLVVTSTPNAAGQTVQQTGTVSRGVVLSSVSATGSIVAAKNLSLDFQNSGTLTEVDVKVGQHVSKGEVLGKIDATDATASVRQAEAALKSAEANLQTTMTGETAAQRRQDSVSVAEATAQVKTAKAAVQSAKTSAASDNQAASRAMTQAKQQLAADQGNEAVALAQKKTDLGSYADLAAAQAAATAAQAAVTADQTRQHDDQQTQSSLQLQQTQWTQQLATDKANSNTAAANNDQVSLNSVQLQLQALSGTLTNDAFQLSQDQAASSTAQATVNAVKADQGSIQSYEAKLVSDRTAVENAAANRTSTSSKGKQSIQQAEQSVTSANLQAKSTALGVAVKQAPPTAGTQAQLESAVVQAQTNLTAAQRTLAETTLRAPVGGTVASVNGIPGQSVAGGGLASSASSSSSSSSTGASTGASTSSSSSAFVTLVGLSSMEVTASFAESDVAKLAVGDPATVTVSALGTTQLAAHIASISATGSSSSSVVQYAVTFALDRSSAKLKPGMTATVAVTVAEKDNVLHVPASAVTGSGQSARVTVLKNGVSQTVPVVAGLKGDSSTEIVSGLTAGQTYVITTTLASTGGTGTATTPSFGGAPGGFGGGLGGGFGGGIRPGG